MLPIFRNALIRLIALIEQFWRWSVQSLSRLLTTFGKLIGLGEGYYVEENAPSDQPVTTVEPASTPSVTAASRRRAGREVDSFRKMAQQIEQDRGA
ncbi:MAG: hypothetical protein F6K28_43085 [Microcoleus sp. SIO2G3]|nr:hypothetical protein [Microcoleus sp. SIO2G3]